MEFIKKFGLYFLGGALAAAAVAFYFVSVRAMSVQGAELRQTLTTRHDTLEGIARSGKIPNPASIDNAKRHAAQIEEQLDRAAVFMASQPRDAHRRRFFENEIDGPDKEIQEPFAWLRAYEKHTQALRDQLTDAGLTAFSPKAYAPWGTGVPSPDQIKVAMELYWYQKDLADFLTQQVEKDLVQYVEAVAGEGGFPAKPADLLINRRQGLLRERLFAFPTDKLRPVLIAILINERQQDLPTIFNTYLPDLPWESTDPARENVLALIMDDAQRDFLRKMLPPDQMKDPFNRQRFLRWIEELRSVRYRTDVIALLAEHEFGEAADSVRKGSKEEHDRLLNDIADESLWTRSRIAQAIATVVSISDEKDFRIIRANHAPLFAELRAMTLMHKSDATGSAVVQNEMYYVNTFGMTVRIEYERIPVFLHRLINSSWRYNVRVLSVVPVDAPVIPTGGFSDGSFGPPAGPPAGPPVGPPVGPPTGFAPPAGRSPVSANAVAEPVVLETRNFVLMEISGEAFQYSPLVDSPKYQKMLEKLSQPAPAAAPAAGPTETP